MRCSMMFKLRAAVACLVLAVVCCIHVWAEPQEPFLPDGSGDMLLVHDASPGSDKEEQVEHLVTMAAALGKVVDYGTQTECLDALNQYDYVVLYDLEQLDETFSAALKKTDAGLMVIGGGTLRQYLTARHLEGRIVGEEPQRRGKFTYTFPTGKEYSCIAQWETLFTLRGTGYESGTLQAGSTSYPFCVQIAGVRFIPLTDMGQALVRAAVMEELTQWMWPYRDSPKAYAQFLVMDGVYPFMPAGEVLEMVEQMQDTGVPYVISVMPLTGNFDYPAMKQFCQVLSLAQAQGATIILHAPIIHKTVEDAQELYERLTDMTLAYIQNGVYPVGIQVPASWLNREPYLTVLGRYNTVFVYDDGQPTYFDLEAHTGKASRQGHQLVFPRIDVDEEGISQLQCYASATYVDCSDGAELLLRYAEAGREGSNPFADLKGYNHQVWLNNGSLTYENRTVYLNGERKETTFQPAAYDKDFDFHRGALTRISLDLANESQFLLVVVAVLLVVFLLGIVYARRQMRRRFLGGGHRGRDKK